MRTIFVDVDTQLDFLMPAGALYAPGAEQIDPNLRALTQFAAAHAIPILSTADAHTENDPEFQTWKPHCVAGTQGQQKSISTILAKPIVVPSRVGALAGLGINRHIPQIIMEKQSLNPFSNPNFEALLDTFDAERFVVYGLVTEQCVAATVFSLLERGTQVDLVSDAIRASDQGAGRTVLARFQHEGGRLIEAVEVCSTGI